MVSLVSTICDTVHQFDKKKTDCNRSDFLQYLYAMVIYPGGSVLITDRTRAGHRITHITHITHITYSYDNWRSMRVRQTKTTEEIINNYKAMRRQSDTFVHKSTVVYFVSIHSYIYKIHTYTIPMCTAYLFICFQTQKNAVITHSSGLRKRERPTFLKSQLSN